MKIKCWGCNGMFINKKNSETELCHKCQSIVSREPVEVLVYRSFTHAAFWPGFTCLLLIAGFVIRECVK